MQLFLSAQGVSWEGVVSDFKGGGVMDKKETKEQQPVPANNNQQYDHWKGSNAALNALSDILGVKL